MKGIEYIEEILGQRGCLEHSARFECNQDRDNNERNSIKNFKQERTKTTAEAMNLSQTPHCPIIHKQWEIEKTAMWPKVKVGNNRLSKSEGTTGK